MLHNLALVMLTISLALLLSTIVGSLAYALFLKKMNGDIRDNIEELLMMPTYGRKVDYIKCQLTGYRQVLNTFPIGLVSFIQFGNMLHPKYTTLMRNLYSEVGNIVTLNDKHLDRECKKLIHFQGNGIMLDYLKKLSECQDACLSNQQSLAVPYNRLYNKMEEMNVDFRKRVRITLIISVVLMVGGILSF